MLMETRYSGLLAEFLKRNALTGWSTWSVFWLFPQPPPDVAGKLLSYSRHGVVVVGVHIVAAGTVKVESQVVGDVGTQADHPNVYAEACGAATRPTVVNEATTRTVASLLLMAPPREKWNGRPLVGGETNRPQSRLQEHSTIVEL
jgi:hypothetical protein